MSASSGTPHPVTNISQVIDTVTIEVSEDYFKTFT